MEAYWHTQVWLRSNSVCQEARLTSSLAHAPALQILDGLMKLPENRECSDCKCK